MLKSQPKTKDIPVLMCSVLNNIKDVEKCCKWGAAGYITKPFDIERVLEKVSEVLK
jgi:response regulator RpfG family c-di-GMP phosphodiesterase